MTNPYILLGLLFLGGVLIFFPHSIDSGLIQEYRTINCDVDVSRIIDGTPTLGDVSCARTTSKCTDLSPFVAWGEYSGSLVMQMNGRASARAISIGVGLPLVTTRYTMTMCSPADISNGDITLYGTSKEVLGTKTFTLT